MKRIFDVLLALLLLPIFLLPMIAVGFLVKVTSKGDILYWSDRIGKGSVIYSMPKFRSMRVDTPDVATHLLENPNYYLSPIGGFLRSSSLDELPQLFSIIKGEMSFVGPRPALYNQDDLIALRTEYGVEKLLPGVTGWAQINGRDAVSISKKVRLDVEYMHRQSFWFDLKILYITFLKVVRRTGIAH